MSTDTGHGSAFAGINVTPLVDITLVLLIIFMVTARLMAAQSVPLDLPKAATGNADQGVFVVTLKSSGDMWVDAQLVVDDTRLLQLGRTSLAQHPDVRAVIHADSAVPHGKVVHVLDVLRQGGLAKIAFAVSPVTTESSAGK